MEEHYQELSRAFATATECCKQIRAFQVFAKIGPDSFDRDDQMSFEAIRSNIENMGIQKSLFDPLNYVISGSVPEHELLTAASLTLHENDCRYRIPPADTYHMLTWSVCIDLQGHVKAFQRNQRMTDNELKLLLENEWENRNVDPSYLFECIGKEFFRARELDRGSE